MGSVAGKFIATLLPKIGLADSYVTGKLRQDIQTGQLQKIVPSLQEVAVNKVDLTVIKDYVDLNELQANTQKAIHVILSISVRYR